MEASAVYASNPGIPCWEQPSNEPKNWYRWVRRKLKAPQLVEFLKPLGCDAHCLLLSRLLGVGRLVLLQWLGTAVVEEVDRLSMITATVGGGELSGEVWEKVDVRSVVFTRG